MQGWQLTGVPACVRRLLVMRRYKLQACADALLEMGVPWKDAERAARATGGVMASATQLVFEGA